MSSAPAPARSWRTAFLTLRDESLGSPPRATVLRLLTQLVLSQSDSLIAAAPELPPDEVLSDLMLLMELARSISYSECAEDAIQPFTKLSHLIHGVTHCSFLKLNSASWAVLLDSFKRILHVLIVKSKGECLPTGNAAVIKATKQCLESLRRLFVLCQTAISVSENEQLLKFALQVVGYFQGESIYSFYPSENHTIFGGVCEVLTVAFSMIGEVYMRAGSCLSVDISQSTIEVLRKVMDVVASQNLLLEDNIIAMFYIELLHCLHLVLTEPKGYLAEHVAGLVAALRIFLRYGLVNKSHGMNQATSHMKEVGSTSQNPHVEVSNRSRNGPYRPPHLRKNIVENQLCKDEFISSDSDSSDNDGTMVDTRGVKFAKARLAAILCIQDLCRADPKLFTAQWTMLLPSNDVLQHRKYDITLMSCLLFDPHLKVRIAAGSTIMALLNGPASVSLQVAEYRGQSKCGSFTALSVSLGHILMQLHLGTLYLFKHETNSRLLALAFKILTLLLSSTPYSRMSGDLLSNVISSVQVTIDEGFPFQSDRNSSLLAHRPVIFESDYVLFTTREAYFPWRSLQFSLASSSSSSCGDSLRRKMTSSIAYRHSNLFDLLKSLFVINKEQHPGSTCGNIYILTDADALNCLTMALSVSPSSTCVNNMLLGEISTGSFEGQQRSGVLYSLFRYSEQLSSPLISLEAFQALKAVAHNYPKVMALCWERVSCIIVGVLSSSSDVPVRLWRGDVENAVAQIKERVITAAVKVLDECLRAISGFKGTEDLSNDKFLDSPFTSGYVKTKAISSAPSYSLESPAAIKDDSCHLASQRWVEATIKHMPIIIKHSSATVRAASVTCFAGMTSSVFVFLPKDRQEFIINSSINAAVDEVPSVRSAACRAIGVIACFPEIYHSTEVLEKFIHAVDQNAHNSLVSVRIPASWALANICDSLSHCMDALHAGSSIESRKSSELISLLVGSALRLARDNDKVKANAVRALGNLSKSVQFTSQQPVTDNPVDFKIENNRAKESKGHMKEMSDSFPSASLGGFDWLGQMVHTFLSCVTTGNVKVQWNVCHALSNLFYNKTLKLQDMDWASSVFSILLLLLRDSSNFKIRIQAAAALAVPETINDYGKSYYDVIKSVEHVVENFKSDQMSEPSNFKYRIALEKQLTSTMLHLLGLAARCDHHALQEFLVKKASFIEVWIKDLCSSIGDTSQSVDEATHVVSITDKKKDVLLGTIRSMIEVYEKSNHRLLAQRFNRLASTLL